MFSQNKKGITSPGMKPNAITQAILLAGITCIGVLGIFRPKTTKCSGGRAVRGLQRGITFR